MNGSQLKDLAERAVKFFNFRKRNWVSERDRERLEAVTLSETPPEEVIRRWQERNRRLYGN